MKISVPNLSTANAITFCLSLPKINFDKTYYFDVSNINNYEPLPMLLTAAAIRQFCDERDLKPWDIQLRYIENSHYNYACHMGFFRSAGFSEGKSPGEASGSTSYIPITKLNIGEIHRSCIKNGEFIDLGDLIERKSAELANVLSQGNVEFKKLLQYLIREAIRNVPEHSGTEDVWICGQYWHNRDIAEVAILDEGIGIFKSLKSNRAHSMYVINNQEALRWAIKPGVSVAFDPAKGQRKNDVWANSGYGLYMMSEICKATNGWFTFVSGEDCMRIYPNNTAIYSTQLRGTAVGIRVKSSEVVKYQTIIDSIRRNGEATAKTIKNAFKEASVPSKGLMF